MKLRHLVLLLCLCLLASCAAPDFPEAVDYIDTGIDPEGWALIPAGEFLYGPHNHPVRLDYDYEMMITPVTNAQYAAYLNRALAEGIIKIEGDQVVGYYPGDTFHNYKHEERIDPGDWLHMPINQPGAHIRYADGSFQSLPGYENHPVIFVTWFGARAYCEFHDARLPTEQEWEKAARGADGRAYPWGNHLARNQANYYSSRDVFEKVFGKAGDTTPVGYYNGKIYENYQTSDSASPYGLYDMAGNVWQWTADIYEGIHYRYLRGGSRMDYGYDLRSFSRNNVRPDYAGAAIGFRCVREPQP